MGKRIVVALGGNALGQSLPEQMAAVKQTARAIAELIAGGNEVVVSHGNGPQVGMLQKAMAQLTRSDPERYIPCPLSVCVAMSQGYIGYDLQNGIRSELIRRGIYKPVSTVLTQMMVNPYDDSFYNPIKKIGRYMTREEADAEEAKGNYVTEVPGKGWQRIVSAPRPVSIVEIDAIRALLDADQIVICCGGGGIPVLEQGSHLKGASAVIEKDLAAGLLAAETDADVLMIATSVANVTLNYGTPEEKPIRHMTVSEAEEYIRQGHFEFASMLPKIEASVSFLKSGRDRKAVITTLDRILDSVDGRAGTCIE